MLIYLLFFFCSVCETCTNWHKWLSACRVCSPTMSIWLCPAAHGNFRPLSGHEKGKKATVLPKLTTSRCSCPAIFSSLEWFPITWSSSRSSFILFRFAKVEHKHRYLILHFFYFQRVVGYIEDEKLCLMKMAYGMCAFVICFMLKENSICVFVSNLALY